LGEKRKNKDEHKREKQEKKAKKREKKEIILMHFCLNLA